MVTCGFLGLIIRLAASSSLLAGRHNRRLVRSSSVRSGRSDLVPDRDTFHVCRSRRVKYRVRRTLTWTAFDTETTGVPDHRGSGSGKPAPILCHRRSASSDTSTTSYPTSQQRTARSSRLAGHAFLHMYILRNHLLIFLEFIPAGMARMIAFQQDIPRLHGLAAWTSFSCRPSTTCACDSSSCRIYTLPDHRR